MQSALIRRSALAASPARLPSRISSSRTVLARRNYAQQAPQTKRDQEPASVSGGFSSRIPLIAAVGLACMIPLFYVVQGTSDPTGSKPVGEGQAAIKEHRREHGASEERRDPRDSGRKIAPSEQKRKESVS